jgi:radical SAM superfamily enzyme YgiQ (UPF0313 family)
MVNISFPSLRVDKVLQTLPDLGRSVRKAGLTIAVEAASDTLRHALRKKVADVDLLEGVRAAFAAGWKHVKLYFMAGFPSECENDIDGIVDLSLAVSEERRKLGKPPAAVTVSVGWLVPKPFTPLQWAVQPRAEYFEEVERRLRARLGRRRAAIRLRAQLPQRSVLEGVLARGDRRLGAAIEEAWRRGARLDAWTERFEYGRWMQAFSATGTDPDFYAHRARSLAELLPWDHIGLHLTRAHLERSYRDLCSGPG